jgi:hypothetical protein
MIGREVITLILSVAVAAVVVALAVRMLPGAGQLAYENPMPVFKVAYSNGAVQLWVEDFAGVPYQRAYFYVDGRYVGSEPPGGKITVRCGDRVAALVQYASGVKEVNGTVMCARPARAPGGTPQLFDTYSATMLEAYQAATGDVERTGVPVTMTGSIDCGGGHSTVTFTVTEPSAFICVGWKDCGQSFTLSPTNLHVVSWKFTEYGFDEELAGHIAVDIYKAPDALASQYLAGIRANFTVTIHEEECYYCGVAESWLYVNGSLLAHAYCAASYSSTTSSVLAGYQKANPSGKYLLDLWWPGSSQMFMGSFAIWQRPGGSWGFEVFTNPTDQTPPSDCPYTISTNFGPVCANLYSSDSSSTYSLFNQFISWVQSNPSAMDKLSNSLKNIADVSYNVPYVAQYQTYTYTDVVIRASLRRYTVNLPFEVLMPASLGAVFANAVLPSDIQAPPVGTPNGTNVPPVSFIVVGN